jgi:two-component sensor histidine kinase
VAFDIGSLGPAGKFLDSEFRIRRPDGALRWLTAHAIVRYGKDGKPIEMIGVNRDITDQKNAARELQTSEERHRLAIEANNLGTWDFDMVTGAHKWSAEFKKLWGLPEDSADDPELLRRLVAPEAWADVQRAWAEAADPATGSGRIAVEYEIRRADTGERRWCSFAGQIFFDEGRTRPQRALGIMMDTTARKALDERHRRMLRELHHRVNNNLAIIQAILSQTVRRPTPRDAFERIQSRLMCLARVHEILNRSEWSEVSLSRLLSGEIDLVEGASDRVSLNGDPVFLDATYAVTLGLVFHELVTNAAKYGAIATSEGRVDITWKLETEPKRRLDIVWNETGAPGARPPRREGFGFRVIKSSVAGNADGIAEVDFRPEGVRWRLGLPMHVTEAEWNSPTVH